MRCCTQHHYLFRETRSHGLCRTPLSNRRRDILTTTIPKKSVVSSTSTSRLRISHYQRYSLLWNAIAQRQSACYSSSAALPNARTVPGAIPVLAFAILHVENKLINTTAVVTTLLGLAASRYDIPKDMWVDILKAPRVIRDIDRTPALGLNPQWCIPEFRPALPER